MCCRWRGRAERQRTGARCGRPRCQLMCEWRRWPLNLPIPSLVNPSLSSSPHHHHHLPPPPPLHTAELHLLTSTSTTDSLSTTAKELYVSSTSLICHGEKLRFLQTHSRLAIFSCYLKELPATVFSLFIFCLGVCQ